VSVGHLSKIASQLRIGRAIAAIIESRVESSAWTRSHSVANVIADSETVVVADLLAIRGKKVLLTQIIAILTHIVAPKRGESSIFGEKSVSFCVQLFRAGLWVKFDFGRIYASVKEEQAFSLSSISWRFYESERANLWSF
jgi:hypothetical protein